MTERKTIADVKVGDRVKFVLSEDSQWEDRFPSSWNYQEGMVATVYHIDIDHDPFFTLQKLSENIDPRGTEANDCDDGMWAPVELAKYFPIEFASAAKKENAFISSFKPIPAIDMDYFWNPSKMTEAQKAKVENEAKEKARKWVIRNYRSWPQGYDLAFSVNGGQLQTRWVEA